VNLKLILSVTLAGCLSALAQPDLEPDLAGFNQNVKPLLQKYCVDCHGPDKQKAKLRFDTIDPDIITGEHFGKWEDVREAFNTGEMPPEEKPQPTTSERQMMAKWLDTEFKKAKQVGSPNKRGNVRRLTRYELQYALEDLLQIPVEKEVGALPEEGTSHDSGLKNSSRLLMISSPHLEAYLNVVLAIIGKMKAVASFEPYAAHADIENLDVNPKVTIAYEKKKNKPPVAKVVRADKAVIMKPAGYIDLKIPSVPKYKFETSIAAKADTEARVEVAIGFQYSDFDPRQIVSKLGDITVAKGGDVAPFSLVNYPHTLPDQMTRALDRPFFIRITNKSKGDVHLEAFDFQANMNDDLTDTLIPRSVDTNDVDRHVRQQINGFVTKAFRRAPAKGEVDAYVAVYQKASKDESPVHALLSTYKKILCAPDFLYLGIAHDLGKEEKANYQLAEKLAFFLWCSVPDQALLDAAATGELTKPAALNAQIERMLKDEKSRRWVEQFTDQWLQTSLLFNVAVDANYYPRFKDPIKDMMHRETVESINDVFRNGSPALNLLKADHVFVNQTLAGFYGIKGVRGDAFQKVAIKPDSHRGGLLTQGTFLVGNSDGMNSHAILRGVWLTGVILKDPPPDPPANVPPLDESIPGFDKMTLNQKLFAHRNNKACKSCHEKIDPWGIAFENYDATGAWREKVLVISKAPDKPAETKAAAKPEPGQKKQRKQRKKPAFVKSHLPIERQATLPDGSTVDGMDKLKTYLIEHKKRDFAKGLVERILACALSRDVDFYDEDLVDKLLVHFEKEQYSVPALIRAIVQSDAF
jgi:hypothetical protein